MRKAVWRNCDSERKPSIQLFAEFPLVHPRINWDIGGMAHRGGAAQLARNEAMSTMALSASDPLRTAAESFIARLRRGERPTFAEYTERFPDQATRIRELFPKLLAVERRANKDQATGPFGPIDDQPQVPRS